MQQQCVLTEKEKLAAVDNAVPTTLPLSLIPSMNKYIMDALTPIIHKKHTPRARSVMKVHNFKSMPALAMQMACTVDGTGDSGASASFAMHDAVAPSAPLTIARLLNVIHLLFLFCCRFAPRHHITTPYTHTTKPTKVDAGAHPYGPSLRG